MDFKANVTCSVEIINVVYTLQLYTRRVTIIKSYDVLAELVYKHVFHLGKSTVPAFNSFRYLKTAGGFMAEDVLTLVLIDTM